MNYKILIEKRAIKSLSKIQLYDRERLIKAIYSLEMNPRPRGAKKLVNRQGWRIRVGDYRVLYDIEDKIAKVLIVDVGHRRDIYDG